MDASKKQANDIDNIIEEELEARAAEEAILEMAAEAISNISGDSYSPALDMPDLESSAQQEIEGLQFVIADLRDQLLRSLAETENLRRRNQKDLEESRKYAVTGFARDLTSVIENLYRAIGSIPEQAKAENDTLRNLGIGLDMTLNDLTATLERHGIKRVWPAGEVFDHNTHQAVSQIDNNDHPAGTVLQVLQAGYTIHDRLLQPAMVCVARNTQAAGSAAPQQHIDTKA